MASLLPRIETLNQDFAVDSDVAEYLWSTGRPQHGNYDRPRNSARSRDRRWLIRRQSVMGDWEADELCLAAIAGLDHLRATTGLSTVSTTYTPAATGDDIFVISP